MKLLCIALILLLLPSCVSRKTLNEQVALARAEADYKETDKNCLESMDSRLLILPELSMIPQDRLDDFEYIKNSLVNDLEKHRNKLKSLQSVVITCE